MVSTEVFLWKCSAGVQSWGNETPGEPSGSGDCLVLVDGGRGKLLVVVVAEENLLSPPVSVHLWPFPPCYHALVRMCLMLPEPCAPTNACPQLISVIRASGRQNNFYQRCPSSSQPQKVLGKFGLFITEELSNEEKKNEQYMVTPALVVWLSSFAVVLWFPKPWGAAAAALTGDAGAFICLQQHPLQGHR